MGSAASLREATDLLLKVLRLRLAHGGEDALEPDQIQPIPPTAVERDSDVRLSLYLVSVSKNGALNPNTHEVVDDTQRAAPLGLELRYLLTAFPDANAVTDAEAHLDQHHVLGAAMQALYDARTIEPESLPPALKESRLTITLEQTDTRELTDVWSTFPELPLHPCALYTVRPVRIDPTAETPIVRVTEDPEVRTERYDPDEESADSTGSAVEDAND